ncbi:MAG TPA: YndJ family transporter [Prosthecobacter sp.]|nr:YndJ family transporter [Prosthecobacter sp.]
MTSRLYPAIGLLIWVLFVTAWRPLPHDPRWIVVLLLFSPLVLMPLANAVWSRIGQPRHRLHFQMPAAALLVPAFITPPSRLAACAALPWLLFCGAAALDALAEFRFKPTREIAKLCLESTRIFPALGAVWLLADRLGWRPFGFDSLIVLLTAAHFHHAGFTLPLIAGLQARRRATFFTRLTGGLILVGVPLVALGITFTHLASWRWLEPWSVGLLVLGAFLVSALQVALAFDDHLRLLPSLLAALSGLALAVAMLLALGYGLRFLWPAVSLAMPLMWAVHGTLNVFGFGLSGILSWRILLAGTRGT